jgi:hypothetical protein
VNLSETVRFRMGIKIMYKSNGNSILDMLRNLYSVFGHADSCNVEIEAPATISAMGSMCYSQQI